MVTKDLEDQLIIAGYHTDISKSYYFKTKTIEHKNSFQKYIDATLFININTGETELLGDRVLGNELLREYNSLIK